MKFLETGKKDSNEKSKSIAKSAPKSSSFSSSSSSSKTEDYSDQNDRRAKQSGYETSANQKRLKES